MMGIDTIVRRVENFDKSIYRVHNSKFQLIQIIVHRSQAYSMIIVWSCINKSALIQLENHDVIKVSENVQLHV